MNKMLVQILGAMNGFAAVLIIIIGMAMGYKQGEGAGLILGLGASVMVAAIVCGVLALGIEIRRELVKMNARIAEPKPLAKA